MVDRVLLINYDFPPALAGVRRMVKMAQYLPEHGFEVSVLASDPGKQKVLDYEALAALERSGCAIHRTASPDLEWLKNSVSSLAGGVRRVRGKLDLSAGGVRTGGVSRKNAGAAAIKQRTANVIRRLASLPDERVLWLATAIPAAERLLSSRAIRYVVTSSYPSSAHLAGLYLKQKFDIHWHADFRDGWTQNPYFADYITPLHRKLNESLERKVAREADSLTAVSRPIAEHLASLSGKNNVFLLPNGFDPTDLDNVPQHASEKFRIAYTGTMFMQRSPDSFFAAVRGLLDCHPGLADNMEIIFRSNFKPEHAQMISELGLDGVVQNWGLGSWREALELQKGADLLLVLEGENPNGHIMLTQKIFEYLATGKPILAVAPEGALAELVRRTRAGVVIHPDNVFRIKETLMELFLGRMQFPRNEELIQGFTRQKQAEQLASILRGERSAAKLLVNAAQDHHLRPEQL